LSVIGGYHLVLQLSSPGPGVINFVAAVATVTESETTRNTAVHRTWEWGKSVVTGVASVEDENTHFSMKMDTVTESRSVS
jgi:hypothetical protein